MKALKITSCVGWFALFLANLFNFINNVGEEKIFDLVIILPLLLIALTGIICGIILICKERKK